MGLIVSVKKSAHGLLVVVTDENLIGKKIEQGKLQLDLTTQFYKGEVKSKQEICLLCAHARHLHLTGKEAVALGVELDLVNPQRILYIQKVPHAEVVREV